MTKLNHSNLLSSNDLVHLAVRNFVTYFARCSSSKEPVSAPVQSTSSVTTASKPTRYSEAVKEKKWRDAMKKEIEALERNVIEPVNLQNLLKRTMGMKLKFY